MTHWTEADERELRRDARKQDRKQRKQAAHTPLGVEPGQSAADYYDQDTSPTPLSEVSDEDLRLAYDLWDGYVRGETFAAYLSRCYNHDGVADANWERVADVVGMAEAEMFGENQE